MIATAQTLRASGLSYSKIAARIGVSTQTVYRWLNPEYAERQRAVCRANKERYRGTCESCGAQTSGCNGPGTAAKLCRACYIEANRPPHGTPSRYRSGCVCD